MHKNRQNSVDSISDIRFDVGMDARRLKKVILLAALETFSAKLDNADRGDDSADYALAMILDTDKLTPAMNSRIDRVLLEMIESAQSKI